MPTRIARPKPKAQKPTGELKQFLTATKNESRITGPLDRHLMTRPLDTSRRQDVLHPSEICRSDWCLLAGYYALSGYPKTPERPAFHLERVFSEGHAVHAKYQRWLHEMGKLYGVYQCVVCGDRQWSRGAAGTLVCPKCEGTVLRYMEVPVSSSKHLIAGHSDGWVVDLGDPALIEIKTVGIGTVRIEAPDLLTKHNNDVEAVWKDIRRPFKKHRIQGQLYLALLELMEAEGTLLLPEGYKRPEEIVFIYEYKPNQQIKEFVVAHDMDAVSDILDNALDVVYAVEKQRPPLCPNGGSCSQCKPYEEG